MPGSSLRARSGRPDNDQLASLARHWRHGGKVSTFASTSAISPRAKGSYN